MTPAPRQTRPLSSPCLVTVALVAVIRHGLPGHDDLTIAGDRHSLRHGAWPARHDTMHSPASMPCPFAAPNAGAMLDLTMRLGLDRSL
jgi:hypothetical protein